MKPQTKCTLQWVLLNRAILVVLVTLEQRSTANLIPQVFSGVISRIRGTVI